MDGRGRSTVKVRQQVVKPTITAALVSAVLEWFLIFLLFIGASFSYFLTKFAHYCQLQIPCPLCSRLDHVLGKEKSGFYWDLICMNHKIKISSLVLCNLHNNLVDVHGMCESCLFSFATVNKSNSETYRLLVGKLGDKPRFGLDQDPLLDDSHSTSNERNCSCCNEQYISRCRTKILFQTKSIRYEAADLDALLLATNGNDRDELTEMKDVSSQKARSSFSVKNDIDPLPHVEYEKVKITSDSESEASFSDDDSATNLINETNYYKQDVSIDYRGEGIVTDNLVSELAYPKAVPETAIVDSEVHMEATDLHCIASPAPTGHGLEELNRQHVEHNTDASAPSDFISFCDAPLPSSNVAQSSIDESREILDVKAVAEMQEEATIDHAEMDELASNVNSANEKQSDLRSAMIDTSSQIPNFLELGDAYKLAVGSRGRQLSGKLLEQKSFKDSARMSEDLKLLLSQLSLARSIELPLNDISPRLSGNIDEFKTSDASSSIGMQILQRRISLERNESGISLDGISVSEIEGESVVDRLKRQVEHDRKLMAALYKELEEERNASAVAANQAMAMITRLQEEKAALHMEALQCLRMMEEQSEYDGEALQKSNDLLAVKEREIHDLEGELQLYKKKFGGVSSIENLVETDCEFNIREISVMQLEESSEQRDTSVCNRGHSIPATCSEIDETANFTGDQDRHTKSSLEFEDETIYILESLKKLEKKFELFSSNEAIVDSKDGDFSVEENVKVCDGKQLDYGKAASLYDATEVDRLLEHASKHNESQLALERLTMQHEDSQHASKGNGELKPGQHLYSDIELDALKNEFLLLRGRLEALKAEHSFLENSMSSLSKGNEGLKFIQEIASQVRELHSIGIQRSN